MIISLQKIKTQLRIEHNDEDSYLTSLYDAAVSLFEKRTDSTIDETIPEHLKRALLLQIQLDYSIGEGIYKNEQKYITDYIDRAISLYKTRGWGDSANVSE